MSARLQPTHAATTDVLPQNLTEQIQSSLLTLRTTTAGQILTSKEAVVKADDKVGQSRRSLSEAERTIREAKKTVSAGRVWGSKEGADASADPRAGDTAGRGGGYAGQD